MSRNTVSKIFKAADQNHLVAKNAESMDDSALHSLLFPEDILLLVQVQPDYAYVHKELQTVRQSGSSTFLIREYPL